MNRRLLDFIHSATRYAQTPNETGAARLIDFAYAGIPRIDARALTIAAGDGGGLRHAMEIGLVPLSNQSRLASRRFCDALDAIASSFRAPGACAQSFIQNVALVFRLDEQLDKQERATFRALERELSLLDETQKPQAATIPRLCEQLARAGNRETTTPTIAALPRREPEPAHPVPRKRMRFSASALTMYNECERRWFYRYVCAAVEDKGSAAALYGTTFHWALEQFHVAFPRADAAPAEELARRLDERVAEAFEHFRSGFATNVEYELQRRRARRTAPRYLDWFIRRSRAEPFSVIGTEAEALLHMGGYDFIGYIDRLDRADESGHVTVIDYKTGFIATSAAEQRTKIAGFLDFQLPFYYWVRTAQGDRVTRLALVPLKDASLDVQPIELEVIPLAAPRSNKDAPIGVVGIHELERARSKMIDLARTLTDDPIKHFKASKNPEACVWCSYQNACRDRPPRAAVRFAK
jgi:RecB family exonuclease